MFSTKREFIFFLSLLIGIYLFAWKLQSALILNWDVSWFLEASRRLLNGGNYTNDFFENNPPLILYLYFFPVLLSSYCHLPLDIALRLFVFLLATLSLLQCYFFINNIFIKKNKDSSNKVPQLILLLLSIIFLILPFFEFGQREHLLIILTMPYFFLITYRLEGNNIRSYCAALVGLFAAAGFALKPYFLPAFILVEAYVCLVKRNIFSWVRAEVLTILGFMLGYLTLISLFHSDYLSIVIPYSWRWVYLSCAVEWDVLIGGPDSIAPYGLYILLLYVSLRQMNAYQYLGNILIIALIGFLFSFFMQRTLFYYHMIPVVSIAFLVLVLLTTQIVLKQSMTKREYTIIVLQSLLMLAILLYQAPLMWIMPIFQPILYFSFFAMLFITLLYLTFFQVGLSYIMKIATLVLFVLLTGCLFFNFIIGTTWYEHRFLLTTIFITSVFIILAFRFMRDKKFSLKEKQHYLIITLFAELMFSYPWYFMSNNYNKGVFSKGGIEKLIVYLKNHPSHSAYFFTTTLVPSSVYAYVDTVSASRFSGFWMLAGQLKQNNFISEEQKIKDKDFLMTMVVDDLNKNKPDLVFVDVSQYKDYLVWRKKDKNFKYRQKNLSYDFLKDFSQYDSFKMAWKNYRYVESIMLYPDFLGDKMNKFAIYKRIS